MLLLNIIDLIVLLSGKAIILPTVKFQRTDKDTHSGQKKNKLNISGMSTSAAKDLERF